MNTYAHTHARKKYWTQTTFSLILKRMKYAQVSAKNIRSLRRRLFFCLCFDKPNGKMKKKTEQSNVVRINQQVKGKMQQQQRVHRNTNGVGLWESDLMFGLCMFYYILVILFCSARSTVRCVFLTNVSCKTKRMDGKYTSKSQIADDLHAHTDTHLLHRESERVREETQCVCVFVRTWMEKANRTNVKHLNFEFFRFFLHLFFDPYNYRFSKEKNRVHLCTEFHMRASKRNGVEFLNI